MPASSPPAADTPPAWRLVAFSLITLPIAGAGLPLAVYLPAYYALEGGLGLTVVGLVFMVGRLWDAAADPLVGVLSDRTRTRFGRRRPWIAAGAVLFALASIALFSPPARPSPTYLAAGLAVFYLGWTMIQIPVSAWAGDLARGYHQRSRVATYVQTMSAAGLLLVLVLPALIDQVWPDQARAKLLAMGGFILATLVPGLAGALFAVREPAASPQAPAAPSALETLGAAARDPLLLRVLGSDFAVTLGQTIRGSLFVFFVVGYMGLPKWGSLLFLLQFVFGVFAGPIWLQVGYRFGKGRTAVAAELVQAAINLGLLFVAPGQFAALLTLTIAQGLAQGSGNLMLRSIVADLADRQRLTSGQERSGVLFSVFSLSGKAATAAAVGLALPLVAALGFHPGGHNTNTALQGLKLVFALGPALSHLVSASLVLGFPLDERRHAEIRRALEARDGAAGLSPSGSLGVPAPAE
ncbi:MFS transporter [Phenylobacterium montanum]|uniref:MFS transporter n=1 Tax=Phenylobacterium montanum TaxID=2823693 RepID=A0A975G2V1_9CAUL|nr:MFS transporter [Caulobacter sp. S6]QUD90125.1 MFS transporter [Caulobacter sp. S6]